MKNIYFIIAAVLILLMMTLPLLSVRSEKPTPDNSSSVVSTDKPTVDPNFVAVLNGDTEKIEKIKISEYVLGVVAAEMSPSFEPEALKAQAVAAHTFLLYRKSNNKNKGYDITTDPTLDQAYINEAERKKKWGDNYEKYNNALLSIIDEVDGLYICYNGKPILAAYHAISGGKTESCKNVWGSDLPYLVSVESIGDILAPNYLTTVSVSFSDLKEAFKDKCKLPNDEKKYIGKITRTKSGTVTGVTIGDKTFKGSELRSAFSLCSSNFDITLNDDGYTFTVRGYGHGVGMSQYGANYMAKQGNTYKEILGWYYKGCSIAKN